jgi:decaprenyl-phosphate phosphoribosyltransferase
MKIVSVYILKLWLKEIRVIHWIKSFFCLLPLFLNGGIFELSKWSLLIPLVVSFSLVSSFGYVLNDVINVKEDRYHPRKRKRPIAHGDISIVHGMIGAGILLTISVLLLLYSYGMGEVSLWVISYIPLSIFYTLVCRSYPFVDVFTLSLGFVFRVAAGFVALNDPKNWWLLLFIYFLAALLAFGKRKGEWALLHSQKKIQLGQTRFSMLRYSSRRLDFVITLTAVFVIVSYILFCLFRTETFPFILSVIPVFLGISNYLRLTIKSSSVEMPEKLFIESWFFMIIVSIWALMMCFFS